MRDQQLFQQVKAGDPEAFETLFRSYYDRLIKFVWGYVKSEAIAEEIIQELFTKIWEEGESIEINRSVKNYLYTSARNMSLDYLKHKKVVQNWEQEKQALRKEKPMTSDLEKNLHQKFVLEEVEKAIQSLPKRRRMIFILSRYEGMTYREIAEFLDISVNTVETQISRALNSLRDRFQHLLTLAAVLLVG
ncbi:RNA polymerase sigma-70 factor [Halalkalibaculum sp. DA384]|uniref:RNA polymerase sigma-70 factor n=1 Tax=Halalkalibaculum sp. DA384 TaxID=3373606 RepID=UPI003754F2E0